MKLTVLTTTGEKTAKVFDLNPEIFAVEGSVKTLRQAVHVHIQNTRTGTAKAKGRAEVSGTGKKPWGNNKMGRARTGDLRTPIFYHGGVSHGPVPMNYSLSMPKKMKKLALNLALTQIASKNILHVVEDITLTSDTLTKEAAGIIQTLDKKTDGDMKHAVLYYASVDNDLKRGFRNLKSVTLYSVDHMNPYDLLRASHVFVFESAMEKLNGSKAKKSEAKPAAPRKTVAVKKATTKQTKKEA